MATSRHGRWHRTTGALVVALLVATSSCATDAGPADPAGDGGQPDSVDAGKTWPDAGPQCEKFGLVYAPTCDRCPSSNSYCPCVRDALNGVELLDFKPAAHEQVLYVVKRNAALTQAASVVPVEVHIGGNYCGLACVFPVA